MQHIKCIYFNFLNLFAFRFPYQPDSLRFEYNECLDCNGDKDPYAGYLQQLKKYFNNTPVIISDFGIPSSRSKSHSGAKGRSLGYHNEKEQGQILSDLLQIIYEENYDMGIMFSFQDEWFKTSWNTASFEISSTRMLWRNRLSNEEHFGILSMDPGMNYYNNKHLFCRYSYLC